MTDLRKILLAIAMSIALVSCAHADFLGGPDLKVEYGYFPNGAEKLTITNLGDPDFDVQNVIVNNKPDCAQPTKLVYKRNPELDAAVDRAQVDVDRARANLPGITDTVGATVVQLPPRTYSEQNAYDAYSAAVERRNAAQEAAEAAAGVTVSIFPVTLTTGQYLDISVRCRPVKVEVVTNIGTQTFRWK